MTATVHDLPLTADVRLRRATGGDVPRMARTYVRSQGHVGSIADRHGITVDAVTHWMYKALQLDEIWLLERDYGEIAGVVAVTRDELDVLDVEPHLRHRGYGTMLLELARRQRPGGLVARVGARRSQARDFLLRHGFTSTGPAGSTGVETLVWGPNRSRWQRAEGLALV